MPTELSVHAVHQGGMQVLATTGGHQLRMDYPLQPGQPAAGFRPLETLLASLAGCAANTLVFALKRLEQPLSGLEVRVTGQRRDQHPTVFTSIAMDFVVRGPDPAVAARALQQAEELLCPVWAMLKGGTTITATIHVAAA